MSVVHHGMPGHFIGARRCCFRMHSTVNGRWKVSTVGCYHPMGADENPEPEPIGAGADALYETMVFDLHDSVTQWDGLSCVRYATEEAAERGHAATVAEWEER